MAANNLTVKPGWVWINSIFIFFFNTFLLPEGFTYTLLLTPVWVYLLYLQGRHFIVSALLIPVAIYAVIHIAHGVDIEHYFISATVIGALFIFLAVCVPVLEDKAVNLDIIFRDIAVLNFIFTIVSLFLLFIPSLKSCVWYLVPISQDIVFPRLKLFTEEASHYSFLLAPVAMYFYSRIMFFKTIGFFTTLFIVTLPLALSFSLGVLGCLLLSGLIIVVTYFRRIFFTAKRQFAVVACIAVALMTALAAYKFYPGNPLFARLHNIFRGDDTSARGRTYEAFILANKVIAQKSYWWGIGPGQLKITGREIIIQYYYYYNIPNVIRIPNACAETIVCFGYVGFFLRLGVETLLFFTTKVYQNPYRVWLFLFVFIYQFTGSYLTNVAEYLVWLLAFSPLFREYIQSKADHLSNPLQP